MLDLKPAFYTQEWHAAVMFNKFICQILERYNITLTLEQVKMLV